MKDSISRKRQIENEVVFRKTNEKAQHELEELKKIAVEEDDQYWQEYSDKPFKFYCECSDENCRRKIALKPTMFKEIHQNRKQFILIPGHQADEIEDEVLKTSKYNVVEKHNTPPSKASGLNVTNIENV